MSQPGLIRHHGEVKEAKTLNNRKIVREEQLLVPEFGRFVKCTPYDDHFIYENWDQEASAYMCTCGSPAVIVPPHSGGFFICMFHAQYNAHQTSFINKDDFKAAAGAGETLRAKGKNQELI